MAGATLFGLEPDYPAELTARIAQLDRTYLGRLVGKSRAIEMMVEGAKMNVAKAAEVGLVNKVWEAASVEEFRAKVVDYARTFCPPNGAAMAAGRIKRV